MIFSTLRKHTFFIFFFSLFWVQTQAQINKEKSLILVLNAISTQFNVTFTYADALVLPIQMHLPPKAKTLEQQLLYLRQHTKLDFKKLSDSNIAILKKLAPYNLCGYLINAQNSQVITGAHIKVLNYPITAVSDSDGFFSLPPINKNQVIEISHISYPAIYLNSTDFIKKNSCYKIYLNTKTETLNEVVINAILTKGIQLTKNNTLKIAPEKLGVLPGLVEPDILQLIQLLPGIQSVNETISNISIRGGSNDQNLLHWNGIKMYHSGHFFGLISAFNPYLVENVTVVKNGVSAQYGDAVSGFVDIQTQDEIKKSMYGGIGSNLLNIDAYVHIPFSDKLALQLSGRKSITDILQTPTFDNYFKRAFQDSKITNNGIYENSELRTNADFSFYDFSGKLLYNINKNHRFRLSALQVSNQLDYQETIIREQYGEQKESRLMQENKAIGGEFKSDWSESFSTRLHAYISNYNIKASNYTLLTEQRLLQENEVLETMVTLQGKLILSKQSSVLTGYDFSEIGITNYDDVNDPVFVRTIKHVIRNHAIYSEFSYDSKNNKLHGTAGMRLNYIEKFNDFKLEPRLNINYQLNAAVNLYGAGELRSQFSTQTIDLQEDFLGVEKRRWILTEQDEVPLLKSMQSSTGISYKKQRFLTSVEGFYKKVTGITASNQGFQNQNQYLKAIGNYSATGVEIFSQYTFPNINTWLSYTFLKNDYTFKTLLPPHFPNNIDVRHSVFLGSTIDIKRFKIGIGLQWRTGKPFTKPNGTSPISTDRLLPSINYETPNSSRLPNYMRTDVSCMYDFKISKGIKGHIAMSLLNVLNQENTLNQYYQLNSDIEIITIKDRAIERTPNMSLRLLF